MLPLICKVCNFSTRISFKFGVLVSLLLSQNAVAAERQPVVPDGEAATYRQRLKQHRIGSLLKHHSIVRSLLTNKFNGLQKLLKATCDWDDEAEECSVSIFETQNLLEESDTEIAKYLLERLECLKMRNGEKCNKNKACLWDDYYEECDFLNPGRGHEDSPCAKAAPRCFDLLEAVVLCEKQDSSTDCKSKTQCHWISSEHYCEADDLAVFLEIENFRDKVAKIGELVQPTIEAEYAALQSAEDFTWQSFLDCKPSSVQCPPGIEPLVCEYIDALAPGVLGPHFYCARKYESAASDCRADALCHWSYYEDECGSMKSAARSTAELAAIRILTRAMPEGIDKKFIETVYRCANISEEASCHRTCVWYPVDRFCDVNVTYLTTLLTEPGKNSTDALCMFLAIDGLSGCYDQSTKEDCRKREVCKWNQDDFCETKENLYISKAAELDPELKDKYLQVKKRCSRHTTLSTCMAEDNSFRSRNTPGT